MFIEHFKFPACAGDTITCQVGGFFVEAELLFDAATTPDEFPADLEVISEAKRQRWEQEAWWYGGINIRIANEDGLYIEDYIHSLWALEVNLNRTGNRYLRTVANDLLWDALDDAKEWLIKHRAPRELDLDA